MRSLSNSVVGSDTHCSQQPFHRGRTLLREPSRGQADPAFGVAVAVAPPLAARPLEASASALAGARRRPSLRSLRTFDALRDRSFRWFMVSMLSQFSSMHMQMVVNPWLVYELTGSYAKLG